MIDIHSHILPGIDDGASDISESLEMARIAVAEGFSSVVATPHYGRAGFFSEIGQARKLVEELNTALRNNGIDLVVYPGMEILVTPEVMGLLQSGNIIPINDRKHVLMELPSTNVPAGFNNLIRSILDSDRKIVIVHPEKNMDIQRRPEMVREILDAFEPGEVLIQITADSLTGDAGLRALSTAKFLVESRLAHIIATDSHSKTERPPKIQEALELAVSLIGKDIAMKMVKEWPGAVIRGESPVIDLPVMVAKKRKWWTGLFG